jgi:hypothetical protein
MTNKELHALRKLLFLSVDECAKHIGQDDDKEKWLKYESGEIEIPGMIEKVFTALIKVRKETIETMEKTIKKSNAELSESGTNLLTSVAYYMSPEEHSTNNKKAMFFEYRLDQSIAAHFLSKGLCVLE